ncbi:MAG TPA: hypothetical protein VJQ82_17480 [Terriglobales bacterium]|nr:hypothetical protein [Terriglobales bacterium]
MKRLSLYVFATALVLGIAASLLTGVVTNGIQSASAQLDRATNAAFRDGLYVGKLDAAQGKRPHLSSGRWAKEADRRNYVDGYQRGFNEVARTAGPDNRLRMAEMVGYRDGVLDGTNDRNAGRRFQLSKNDNYRTATRGVAETEPEKEQSRRAYRQGYANGYQQAYYGKKSVDGRSAGELSSSL